MILGRVIVVSIDFSIEGITLMDEVWLKDGRKCSKCNQFSWLHLLHFLIATKA